MADPSTSAPLTRASVAAAHDLVRPHVHRTPTVRKATLSALASRRRDAAELAGTTWEFELAGEAGTEAGTGTGTRKRRTPANPRIRLWLKCENFQRVGAFKVRGAFHALERLAREPGWAEGGGRERGVVTHSSGAFLFFFFVLFFFSLAYFLSLPFSSQRPPLCFPPGAIFITFVPVNPLT